MSIATDHLKEQVRKAIGYCLTLGHFSESFEISKNEIIAVLDEVKAEVEEDESSG